MGTETVQLLEQLNDELGKHLYITATDGVAVGASFSVDGGSSGAVILRNLAITETSDVYWEHDIDGDGSYEVSVKVESFSSTGLSMLNNVPVSSNSNLRLRLENTGGAPASYIVTGLKTST